MRPTPCQPDLMLRTSDTLLNRASFVMGADMTAFTRARTFGDLKLKHACKPAHFSAECSFCKANELTPGFKGARQYSTRHYICDPCIAKRRDEVLPAIRKREAFDASMKALGAKKAAA